MYIILTVLNGLFFVAWAVVMFYTLFAQRRRVAKRTGKMFPGIGDALHEWRHWWQSPDLRGARRLLTGLTIGLMISVVLMATYAPPR